MKIGIDLGGTKIEVIALSEVGEELFRQRVATPKGDYAGTVQAIVGLVTQAHMSTGLGILSIGVGIPGAISKVTGRVKNANSTWLIGEDLQGDLQRALSSIYQGEVKLANDANCFALSEATDGAAAGASCVFGVIIGTGCGGGVVVNGQILNGVNSIAGEWGHNPLPWATEKDEQLPCYCGKRGCLETFISGSGLERQAAVAKVAASSVGDLTAKEIVAMARQGEQQAKALMQRYYDWLAKGLASVINVLDPDVIVLGGGMGNVVELYEEIPKRWQQWVFSDRVDTQLSPPKFGDSSGVRGAAWL